MVATAAVASTVSSSLAFDKLTINPEYSKYAYDLFPLTAEEYNSLKADIASSKIHNPISINKAGVILDGHHRYKIALELGIKEFPVIVESFENPLDELYFVVNINTLRRHLNDYQKAQIAFELEKIESQKAKQRQLSNLRNNSNNGNNDLRSSFPPNGSNDDDNDDNSKNMKAAIGGGEAAQIVAEKVGISTRSYQRAKVIIQHGDQKMQQSVRSGKMSISFAEKTIRNKESKKQRIAQLMKESCSDNGNSFLFNNDRFKLFTGNFIEQQSNIADNSIDLIFTDPPYDHQNLPLYKDLGDMAFRVLKDGGSLLCYAGNYALLEIGHLLERSQLSYWWTIAVEHSGNIRRMHKQKVWPYWKPILWFVKSNRNNAPGDTRDLIKSQPVDKALHPWQQSTIEAEYYINYLTVEGQTVLDPFVGSGTTGLAALKLNRRFIGIELDPSVMDVARANITNFFVNNATAIPTAPTADFSG